MEALAAWAQREDLWILADEVYEDYSYDAEHTYCRPLAPERTFAAHSFSKAYGMAGNRCGYIVGPAEAMPQLRKIGMHSFYSTPTAAQIAALRVLQGPGPSWIAQVRESYRAAGERAAARLGIAPPEGSTFLFLDVADRLDERGLGGFSKTVWTAASSSPPGRASDPIRRTSGSAIPRRRPTWSTAASRSWPPCSAGSAMAAVEDPKVLGGLELFRHDPGAAGGAQRPAARIRGAVGSPLHHRRAAGRGGLRLLEGTVKIYISREDGREVILAFLGRGDTVGEMSLVDSAGRSANVMTTERTRLLWMDRATFQTCLRSVAAAGQQPGAPARQPAPLRQRADPGALHPGRPRPGRAPDPRLSPTATARSPWGGTIPLRLTQSDLADLVGASRERVNQVIVEAQGQAA